MAKHTFSYVFVLSISIPYETSILSYCSIFITHTDTHLNKFGDDIYYLVQKQIYQQLLTYETLIVYLKANHHLNLIYF